MSRLMTGILLVALLGLTAGMAWAQRPDNGVGGSDATAYVAGDPPTYDASNPDGFPVEATATFKAHVLAYAHLAIDPPKNLVVPGDKPAGTPGEDSIEPGTADGGMITVEANHDYAMTVEVSEFSNEMLEQIWTEVKLGVLDYKWSIGDPWFNLADYSTTPVWLLFSNNDASWTNFGQTWAEVGPGPNGGTIVLSRDMLVFHHVEGARYWQLPFGAKAKNRTWDPSSTTKRWDGTEGYTTLAASGDYTATMVATLTAAP